MRRTFQAFVVILMTLTMIGSAVAPVMASQNRASGSLRWAYISGSATGGKQVTIRITLWGEAPAGGSRVLLMSSNPAVQVPGLVTVPAGESEVLVKVKTSAVTENTRVLLTARLGDRNRRATVVVLRPYLSSTTVQTRIKSGSLGKIIVRLSGIAPEGGVTVKLNSNRPSVLPVPASVFIPAGKSSVSTNVPAAKISKDADVNVTALYSGIKITKPTIVRKFKAAVTEDPTATATDEPTATATVDATGTASADQTATAISDEQTATAEADMTATQVSIDQTATQVSDDATATQTSIDQTATAVSEEQTSTAEANLTATQTSIDLTATQTSIDQTATQVTSDETATASADQTATQAAADQTATRTSDEATATQQAIDATSTQVGIDQTATQVSVDQTATQVSIDATATQRAVDATSTQTSIDQTATQVAIDFTATQQASDDLATKVAGEQTATAVSWEQTATSEAATQVAIDMTATQSAADATATQQSADATATQLADDLSATQVAADATATQAAHDATETQQAADATATQVSFDQTATQIAADASATQVALDAMATRQAADATATQLAADATATQQATDLTATASVPTATNTPMPSTGKITVTRISGSSTMPVGSSVTFRVCFPYSPAEWETLIFGITDYEVAWKLSHWYYNVLPGSVGAALCTDVVLTDTNPGMVRLFVVWFERNLPTVFSEPVTFTNVTATSTAIPPTATATNTAVPPTATNTAVPPTATATNTAVPPTATPTNTTVPPTATATEVPPTATSTPLPLKEEEPVPQSMSIWVDAQTAPKGGTVWYGFCLTQPTTSDVTITWYPAQSKFDDPANSGSLTIPAGSVDGGLCASIPFSGLNRGNGSPTGTGNLIFLLSDGQVFAGPEVTFKGKD